MMMTVMMMMVGSLSCPMVMMKMMGDGGDG
jgi:hypothetical protein